MNSQRFKEAAKEGFANSIAVAAACFGWVCVVGAMGVICKVTYRIFMFGWSLL